MTALRQEPTYAECPYSHSQHSKSVREPLPDYVSEATRVIVNDLKTYRIAGACGLVSIAVFFIEFPLYFLRGPFPSMAESFKLGDFAARNATNIMTCVLFDLVILSLILIFLAGFRHLIRQAQPEQEWLGTLVFGIGVVYTTITLIADSLQGATVVDALAVNADSTAIRTMMESMYLMYGSVALFLMALLMAAAGYATVASRALPAWSGLVGYACAVVCLAFVPSMFVGKADPTGFYNPAGWGPTGVAAGFPLATWMIVVGILMMRKREPAAPSAIT